MIPALHAPAAAVRDAAYQEPERGGKEVTGHERTDRPFSALYAAAWEELPWGGEPTVSKHTLRDLEVFCGYDRPEANLFAHVDRTRTVFGYVQLQRRLAAPKASVPAVPAGDAELRRLLDRAAEYQQDALDLLRPPEVFKEYEEMAYPLPEWVVASRPHVVSAGLLYTLVLCPLTNVAAPALVLIVPWILVRMDAKLPLAHYGTILKRLWTQASSGALGASGRVVALAGALANLIGYCISAYQTYQVFTATWRACIRLQRGMVAAVRCMDAVAHADPSSPLLLPAWRAACTSAELVPSGTVLHLRRSALDKDWLRRLLGEVGRLDADQSVAALAAETGLRPARALPGPKAELRADALQPPAFCVKGRPVPNDVRLEGTTLLTSPNAGGKSTVLRSVGYAALMAQTLGVAHARDLRLTPFPRLETIMVVHDEQGKASLFQMEVQRLRAVLGGGLLLMDELFNTTNADEGAAAAYGVLRYLCGREDCVAVVSTHLHALDCVEGCTKLHLAPDREPYRLYPGFSKDRAALRMVLESLPEEVAAFVREYSAPGGPDGRP